MKHKVKMMDNKAIKRYINDIYIVISIMFVIVFLSGLATKRIIAKTNNSYYALDLIPEGSEGRCRIRNYYFYKSSQNLDAGNTGYYYSSSYTGKGTKICDVDCDIVTNGKTLYYMVKNRDEYINSLSVYKKSLSNKSASKLVANIQLSEKIYDAFCYGFFDDKLYVQLNFISNEQGLYALDLSKKVLSKNKLTLYKFSDYGKEYTWLGSYGQYIYFSVTNYNTWNEKLAVYDCKTDKVIKNISAGAAYIPNSVYWSNNKAYFTFREKDGDEQKYTYKGYSCSLAGNNLKKLWNRQINGSMSQVITMPKAAYYADSVTEGDTKYYKYIYSTKKAKEISKAKYYKQAYRYSVSSSSSQTEEKTIVIGSGSNKCTYVVTSDTNNKRTVSLKSISGTAKKLELPIKITDPTNSQEYKVTGIKQNAAHGHTKLLALTISGNIKTIGSGAFSGCSNLSDVTIYADNLTKVGKDAFEGIKDGAVVKIEAKNEQHYSKIKKLLKTSGLKRVVHKYRISTEA